MKPKTIISAVLLSSELFSIFQLIALVFQPATLLSIQSHRCHLRSFQKQKTFSAKSSINRLHASSPTLGRQAKLECWLTAAKEPDLFCSAVDGDQTRAKKESNIGLTFMIHEMDSK